MEEKVITHKLYKKFEIDVPNNWRESTLNTIIHDLSSLYSIEKDNGLWDGDIRIKTTNNIIDNLIIQLNTLKIKEEQWIKKKWKIQ